MRDAKEVGGFKAISEDANEAYRAYASIWLDFVDDNVGKFIRRGNDIVPMHKAGDDASDEKIEESYLDAALNIALATMKNVSPDSEYANADFYAREYPPLRKRMDALKAAEKVA